MPGWCEIDKAVRQAQHFAHLVAREYWTALKRDGAIKWRIRRFSNLNSELPISARDEAIRIGREMRSLLPAEAGFSISQIYARKLPRGYRARYGVYYTPLPIVHKMLKDSAKRGVDLAKAVVIDPSSGGASFLAPLTRAMFRSDMRNQQRAIEDISARLRGLELDPFGAWLSQFLVDCELMSLAPKADRPPQIVTNCNALAVSPTIFDTYDYVVGNPPYGKLNGSCNIPDHFQDVLAGQPNLYQLFLKLAFLLAKRGGVIHQITPTGFIGGYYSRRLRDWIQREGAPLQFDFLEKRTGVFESVQQELMISLFKRGSRKRVVDCNVVKCRGTEVEELPLSPTRVLRGRHWVLPRRPADRQVVAVFDGDLPTLESAGFQVKTGYVVPYRHDEFLTPRKKKNSYPLIWAEAIRSGGLSPEYAYSHGRIRWMTHIKTCPGLISKPCVLIKRTSSKEQAQRIQAAVVSSDFINEYGGFYAENHINVLIPEESSATSLEGLTKLLQTDVVNSLFRCINGTVTVSATELIRLPMPTAEALKNFTKRTKRLRHKHPCVEVEAMHAYGLKDGEA